MDLGLTAVCWHSRFEAKRDSLALAPGRLETLCFVFLQHLRFKRMPAEFNLTTAQRLPLPIRTSEFALFRLTPSRSDRCEAGK